MTECGLCEGKRVTKCKCWLQGWTQTFICPICDKKIKVVTTPQVIQTVHDEECTLYHKHKIDAFLLKQVHQTCCSQCKKGVIQCYICNGTGVKNAKECNCVVQ